MLKASIKMQQKRKQINGILCTKGIHCWVSINSLDPSSINTQSTSRSTILLIDISLDDSVDTWPTCNQRLNRVSVHRWEFKKIAGWVRSSKWTVYQLHWFTNITTHAWQQAKDDQFWNLLTIQNHLGCTHSFEQFWISYSHDLYGKVGWNFWSRTVVGDQEDSHP